MYVGTRLRRFSRPHRTPAGQAKCEESTQTNPFCSLCSALDTCQRYTYIYTSKVVVEQITACWNIQHAIKPVPTWYLSTSWVL